MTQSSPISCSGRIRTTTRFDWLVQSTASKRFIYSSFCAQSQIEATPEVAYRFQLEYHEVFRSIYFSHAFRWLAGNPAPDKLGLI
jgi:hypothetical protein